MERRNNIYFDIVPVFRLKPKPEKYRIGRGDWNRVIIHGFSMYFYLFVGSCYVEKSQFDGV